MQVLMESGGELIIILDYMPFEKNNVKIRLFLYKNCSFLAYFQKKVTFTSQKDVKLSMNVKIFLLLLSEL